MEKEISVVLIDTKKEGTSIGKFVKDKQPTLDDYYKLLNCDCIDIIRRRVGKKYYYFIVDDEGLLKPNPIFSIATFDTYDGNIVEKIAGNVLVVRYNKTGTKLASLTDEDIENINNFVVDCTPFGARRLLGARL